MSFQSILLNRHLTNQFKQYKFGSEDIVGTVNVMQWFSFNWAIFFLICFELVKQSSGFEDRALKETKMNLLQT